MLYLCSSVFFFFLCVCVCVLLKSLLKWLLLLLLLLIVKSEHFCCYFVACVTDSDTGCTAVVVPDVHVDLNIDSEGGGVMMGRWR